jgi:CheY-like chemotaxis protein
MGKSAKKTMLVVDDEPVSRTVLCGCVKSMGFTPVPAESGAEALKILKDQTEVVADLAAIFSDVLMPGMQGGDLLDELRDDPRFQGVPFFMVSAHSDEFFQRDAKRGGAKSYLLKPVRREDLVEILNGAGLFQEN